MSVLRALPHRLLTLGTLCQHNVSAILARVSSRVQLRRSFLFPHLQSHAAGRSRPTCTFRATHVFLGGAHAAPACPPLDRETLSTLPDEAVEDVELFATADRWAPQHGRPKAENRDLLPL